MSSVDPLVGIPILLVVLIARRRRGVVGTAKPGVVKLDVSGPAGMPITGTCEIDGNSRELTDIVPTQFVLNGTRVTFLVGNDRGFR